MSAIFRGTSRATFPAIVYQSRVCAGENHALSVTLVYDSAGASPATTLFEFLGCRLLANGAQAQIDLRVTKDNALASDADGFVNGPFDCRATLNAIKFGPSRLLAFLNCVDHELWRGVAEH